MQGQTVLSAIPKVAFLAHISFLPVQADSLRHLCQPHPVFGHFRDLCRGKELDAVLRRVGPLFPRMARIKENHRAKMFIKRLKTVGITGISMHSYRYAWAERAKTVGMPERFAQQALGHSSKAFARAYSKKAKVIVA